MGDFFEKLKKGMKIKDIPETVKEETESESIDFDLNEPDTKKENTTTDTNLLSSKRKILENLEIEKDNSTTNKKTKKTTQKKQKKKKTSLKKTLKEKMQTNKKSIEVKKEKKDTSFKQEKERNWFTKEGELTVDVYKTDKEIVVRSPISGVEAEDIDVSIENDMLIIRGYREEPESSVKKEYLIKECFWGPFSKEIILPEEIDNSRVKASLKNGILTIKLPIVKTKGKRKIIVQE